ncbi:hypothetical protein GH733_009152 [Mirounga leonina]|nr:hypothetical protein GH733_009152 [Mirounga leonina]
MKNLVWTSGISALDGKFQSASEVDFYINKDMIHITDTKVARHVANTMMACDTIDIVFPPHAAGSNIVFVQVQEKEVLF